MTALDFSLTDFLHEMELAERRKLVRDGKLPGSSRYAHAVALGVDHVWIGERIGSARLNVLTPSTKRALNDTTTGAHELWFNDQGEARMSFEDAQDATLFRLALDV